MSTTPLEYATPKTYSFDGGQVVMYRSTKTALVYKDGKTYKVANTYMANTSLMFDIIDQEGSETPHTFMGEDCYRWDGDVASLIWEAVDLHMDKLATKATDVARAYRSMARFL